MVYAKSWGALLTTEGRQRRAKSLTNTSTGSPTSKKMKAARDGAIYMHPFPRPRCGSNLRGDG